MAKTVTILSLLGCNPKFNKNPTQNITHPTQATQAEKQESQAATIINQLDQDEKEALAFLRDALKDSTIDANVSKTHTDKEIDDFIVYADVTKLKKVLENIVKTLKTKREAEDAIAKITTEDQKNQLTNQLQEAEKQSKTMLKAASSNDFDSMYNNLKVNDDANQFENIKNQAQQ
ncbi:BTA121 domain-containing protein surface lipoprotein [Borrelia persica]|uniref:BTA121 domain-containing protein surface lipoprotein n=1 Tax=Borrelia persica TaxID=44448 RepID=UPI000467CAD7|nr:hypothetical protein [Borrelia persica]